MLEIAKFKLINGGNGGVIIEGREAVQLSKYRVIDEIKRTRRLVLPADIIYKVQKLKYFFLNCTGHWMPPFNKYYDITNNCPTPLDPGPDGKIKDGQEMLRNLLNKTEITSISYKNGGFVITGTIEAVEGKKTVINTPFITEEDDLGFFSSAIDCIGDCIHAIVNTFSANILPEFDPKTILSEEEMKGLDMSELTNLVVEKLVDRNMIMLVKDDETQEALPESTEKKTKLSTSKKNIDSKNIPEAKSKNDHKGSSDDEEESPADKAIKMNLAGNKKDPFGKPASDAGMPDEFKSNDKIPPKDLEDLEHSENMGIDETENEKETWED